MTAFQIVVIILTVLGLFGGIITVYVKTQVDIAKINVTITFFQKDLDRKELALTKLEISNKEQHEMIEKKIDKLIDQKYE
jgi:hypothetical protein